MGGFLSAIGGAGNAAAQYGNQVREQRFQDFARMRQNTVDLLTTLAKAAEPGSPEQGHYIDLAAKAGQAMPHDKTLAQLAQKIHETVGPDGSGFHPNTPKIIQAVNQAASPQPQSPGPNPILSPAQQTAMTTGAIQPAVADQAPQPSPLAQMIAGGTEVTGNVKPSVPQGQPWFDQSNVEKSFDPRVGTPIAPQSSPLAQLIASGSSNGTPNSSVSYDPAQMTNENRPQVAAGSPVNPVAGPKQVNPAAAAAAAQVPSVPPIDASASAAAPASITPAAAPAADAPMDFNAMRAAALAEVRNQYHGMIPPQYAQTAIDQRLQGINSLELDRAKQQQMIKEIGPERAAALSAEAAKFKAQNPGIPDFQAMQYAASTLGIQVPSLPYSIINPDKQMGLDARAFVQQFPEVAQRLGIDPDKTPVLNVDFDKLTHQPTLVNGKAVPQATAPMTGGQLGEFNKYAIPGSPGAAITPIKGGVAPSTATKTHSGLVKMDTIDPITHQLVHAMVPTNSSSSVVAPGSNASVSTPSAGGGGRIAASYPVQPTSSTRTMIETAPKVLALLDRTEALLNQQEKNLGPLKSRWSEFFSGDVGAPNPGFRQLMTDADLLSTLLMRMHVGAKGSEAFMAHFQDMIGAAKQDPANMHAMLGEIRNYANEVLNGTNVGSGPDQSGRSGNSVPNIPPAAASGGVPSINTKQEHDALPSGSKYIDAQDGKTYTKR